MTRDIEKMGNRRDFLKVAGIGFLSGLSACTPYVDIGKFGREKNNSIGWEIIEGSQVKELFKPCKEIEWKGYLKQSGESFIILFGTNQIAKVVPSNIPDEVVLHLDSPRKHKFTIDYADSESSDNGVNIQLDGKVLTDLLQTFPDSKVELLVYTEITVDGETLAKKSDVIGARRLSTILHNEDVSNMPFASIQIPLTAELSQHNDGDYYVRVTNKYGVVNFYRSVFSTPQ